MTGETRAAALAQLGFGGRDSVGLEECLRGLAPELVHLGVPTSVRKAVAAWHTAPWFTVKGGGAQTASTAIGARPGDPLADLLFNVCSTRSSEKLGNGSEVRD